MIAGIRAYLMLGVGLAFALVLAWGMRVDHLRGQWKLKFDGLSHEVTIVLPAIREASGNDKLQWRPGKHDETAVAEQVRLLGKAKATWQQTATDQSQRIAELGTEAERLKRLSDEARKQAERAIAQRNTALAKLEQMELTPSERLTCEQQLKAAEDALDIAYRSGI